MRIFFWVILLGSMGHYTAHGQEDYISYDKDIKYTFERYSGTKTTAIRQGALLKIYATIEDTSIDYSGYFISANNSTITINCNFLGKYLSDQDHDFSEEKEFAKDNVLEIPFETVDYMEKYNVKPGIPATIASMGVTSAVFAPLFCINKNYEYRFNVKRYVEILKYSAVAVISGSIVAAILTSNKKYILKPKLVSGP